ncbi:hypothetical protein BGX30_003465 [Mortierella sp. GBA39]|nr:hypothetical protein BGX30_003465 [Mortierella sp. GBA39]
MAGIIEARLYQKDSYGRGHRQPDQHGLQVPSRQLERADAANGCGGNQRPGDQRAAADPDRRHLAEGRQRGCIGMRGGREQLGDRAGERNAGETGAVESGDGPGDRQRDGAHRSVQRHYMRQRGAQIVDDAVRGFRQHLAEEVGKRRIAEVEKGGDRNDRTEYFKTEGETVDQVRGHLFKPLVPVGKQRYCDQDQYGRTAYERRGVSALQLQHKHGGYVDQKQHWDDDGQPYPNAWRERRCRFFRFPTFARKGIRTVGPGDQTVAPRAVLHIPSHHPVGRHGCHQAHHDDERNARLHNLRYMKSRRVGGQLGRALNNIVPGERDAMPEQVHRDGRAQGGQPNAGRDRKQHRPDQRDRRRRPEKQGRDQHDQSDSPEGDRRCPDEPRQRCNHRLVNTGADQHPAHRHDDRNDHDGAHQLFGRINKRIKDARHRAAQRFGRQPSEHEDACHTDHRRVPPLDQQRHNEHNKRQVHIV